MKIYKNSGNYTENISMDVLIEKVNNFFFLKKKQKQKKKKSSNKNKKKIKKKNLNQKMNSILPMKNIQILTPLKIFLKEFLLEQLIIKKLLNLIIKWLEKYQNIMINNNKKLKIQIILLSMYIPNIKIQDAFSLLNKMVQKKTFQQQNVFKNQNRNQINEKKHKITLKKYLYIKKKLNIF
ncbi:hypothetical protein IMG5_030070 [Ichthyophthirius multifiliis]|uniref:Uncharacterized protein n=1 Tax=Ichthyophthirius multifiliis TaxID=5932 RepID=G0QLG2_ICHMU|nr:hypothetical protein IMG5_030070 [Ichthyophthirius multifiliis]EGR33943.1 hypothetical protein IMG5_030070 [Ichthyophthirius multifiliis]|eukprot:XP_004039247.1 hypothetical protein IMG5_030070 [Ichthyophthirius multifiliis]